MNREVSEFINCMIENSTTIYPFSLWEETIFIRSFINRFGKEIIFLLVIIEDLLLFIYIYIYRHLPMCVCVFVCVVFHNCDQLIYIFIYI